MGTKLHALEIIYHKYCRKTKLLYAASSHFSL